MFEFSLFSENYNLKSLFRRIVILLGLFSILASSGCAPQSPDISQPSFIEKPISGTPSPTYQKPPRQIALVMKTLTNPFFIEMEKGARTAEKEMGIHLIVKTAAQETSIEQQIEIVEGLIKDGVDAIVIAPGDSFGLIPVLKKAQDAGIKIVNIDNQLDVATAEKVGLADIPFISVDNKNGAYLSFKYVIDQAHKPVNAAIVEGIRTAKNADERKNGALKAINESKDVQLVATETAHWKIDEAYDVTKKMFEGHSDINVLFCANDMMALGAIKYLQESNRKDVLVAGFDALDEAKQAIRSGNLTVTVDQQAALQGYTGVKYAVMLLNGEKVPAETMVDVKLVTLDTLK